MALTVPVVAYLTQAVRYGRWLVDDALITFAYARTISEGGGFAQQPGASPVEGISDPLWAVILVGLRAVGLFDQGRVWWGVDDLVLPIKVLAFSLFVATLGCFYFTGRAVFSDLGYRWLGVGLAGTLLALSPNYVIWSVSGLENPLYGFLVAALAAVLSTAIGSSSLFSARVVFGCALLAVLLAATRPDGLIFVAAYPLAALWVGLRAERVAMRRGVLIFGVAVAIPAGLLMVWRHRVFGLWVPNTAVAKGQQGLGAVSFSRLSDLGSAAGITSIVVGGAAFVLCVLLPVIVHRQVLPRVPAALVGVAAPFVLAVAAVCVLNRDWMREFRFATPAAVLGSLLLGLLLVCCVRVLAPVRSAGPVVVVALVTVVLAALQAIPRVESFAANPNVSGCYVANRYGRTFNLYADRLGLRNATLLLPDLGGALLTTRLQLIDLVGLTDPTIARYRSKHDAAGLRRYLLHNVRPTFVHAHPPWDPGLTRDPHFRSTYVRITPGDYVRRDVVDHAQLTSLRIIGAAQSRRSAYYRAHHPRRSCGPMKPGQTGYY